MLFLRVIDREFNTDEEGHKALFIFLLQIFLGTFFLNTITVVNLSKQHTDERHPFDSIHCLSLSHT